MRNFYVYIVTNSTKTVLYTGFTNNLERRLAEHAANKGNSKTFTGRYNACYLLYFEVFNNPTEGIAREKEIKGWRRDKKIGLIQTTNPDMAFLN
jgi:putative endonuclease